MSRAHCWSPRLNPRDHPRLYRFDPISELPLGVPATVVASRNDPLMRLARARSLAKHWRAGFIDLGAAGHVNLASGFGPWPAGLMLRDDLIRRAAVPQTDERTDDFTPRPEPAPPIMIGRKGGRAAGEPLHSSLSASSFQRRDPRLQRGIFLARLLRHRAHRVELLARDEVRGRPASGRSCPSSRSRPRSWRPGPRPSRWSSVATCRRRTCCLVCIAASWLGFDPIWARAPAVRKPERRAAVDFARPEPRKPPRPAARRA